MSELTVDQKNEIVMKLLHYFITVEGYNPIILHGAENEIWLEKLDGSYKIIRIVSNYIHNNEQFHFDIFKTKKILQMIKKKTLSLRMKVLSIFVDLGDNVSLESVNNIDCIHVKDEKDIKKYDVVIKKFPDIISKLKHTEDGMNLFMKITSDINKKNEEEGKKANAVFSPKKPYLTYGLIAINILVYLLMSVVGNGSTDVKTLIQFGALYPPLVRSGEYYRLLTDAFIHIGLLHLFFNCYVLNVIGAQIETFYGKSKYLIIYVFSALTASLMSMIFTKTLSAGASGAIFGLLGASLYFGYHYRVYLGNALRSQIIPLIVINLLIGYILPGVDNAAHIGGLIGGTIIAVALGVKHKSSNFEKINGLIVSTILFIFLIYLALIYIK